MVVLFKSCCPGDVYTSPLLTVSKKYRSVLAVHDSSLLWGSEHSVPLWTGQTGPCGNGDITTPLCTYVFSLQSKSHAFMWKCFVFFITDLRIRPKHPEDRPLQSATANCWPCMTTTALQVRHVHADHFTSLHESGTFLFLRKTHFYWRARSEF